jgi:hypothetical protein
MGRFRYERSSRRLLDHHGDTASPGDSFRYTALRRLSRHNAASAADISVLVKGTTTGFIVEGDPDRNFDIDVQISTQRRILSADPMFCGRMSTRGVER